MKTYKETCDMFEQTEIAEQVYEGGTPSKTPTRADANREGHIRKCKGGESASPTNPKKGRSDKRKTKNSGYPSNVRTVDKKIFILHGPVHSYEECK